MDIVGVQEDRPVSHYVTSLSSDEYTVKTKNVFSLKVLFKSFRLRQFRKPYQTKNIINKIIVSEGNNEISKKFRYHFSKESYQMDPRIKFLEGKLRYLQGQLTANLFNRQTQTLVNHNLTDEVNHVTDRIRHYLVHLHTKCETTNDFIAYCKEVDNEFEDAGQEHLFCTEFNIPYTGKLDKSVLIHFKTGMATRIREINSLHIEKKRLYINGQKVAQDIRRFIFVDKAFELDKNDETEFNELIEHFKSLKERLKLQNIGEDFK